MNDLSSNFALGNPKLASLEKCFLSIVDGMQVNLDLPVVKYLITNGFNLNLTDVDEVIAEVLPYVFIYHVNQWSGWQQFGEYQKGNLSHEVWFKRLCIYLHSILMETIHESSNTNFKEGIEEIKNKKKGQKTFSTKATQTTIPSVKPIAPFSINIKSTAAQLNTLVFSELNEYDLELKHNVPYPWPSENVDIKALLSWPYVAVHFSSPILQFERGIKLGSQHYLSHSKDTMTFATENKMIESTSSGTYSRKVAQLPYDSIEMVISELLKVLNMCTGDVEQMAIFKAIFTDFLDDIKELTEENSFDKLFLSSVSFGKCIYYRNKECSTGGSSYSRDSDGIKFYEVLSPKIELHLLKLESESNTISYLESFKAGRKTAPKPTVQFKCSYCDVNCGNSLRGLVNHLFDEHTMEPPMTCVDCRSIFNVDYLAKNRWNHSCT